MATNQLPSDPFIVFNLHFSDTEGSQYKSMIRLGLYAKIKSKCRPAYALKKKLLGKPEHTAGENMLQAAVGCKL